MQFSWDKAFSNTNVNEKWINRKIKSLTQEISNTFQLYGKIQTSACFRNRLNFPQDHLKNLMEVSKQKYYSRIAKKISRKSPNTFWSLLKLFLNNTVKRFSLHHPSFMKKTCNRFQRKGRIFQSVFNKTMLVELLNAGWSTQRKNVLKN